MNARRKHTDTADRDIRTLLWMDRPIAMVVAVVFCLSSALRAATYLGDSEHFWPILLALALTTAGVLAIVAVPGDPLPLPATVLLTAIGPATCLLVLPQIPAHGWIMSDIWHLRAVTIILCFMSVRGRPWFAEAGAASSILVFTIWTGITGQGWGGGLRTSLVVFAPVLISLLVASAVRPMAQRVFALRELESERAADEAMTAAVTSERESQLEALDSSARPILEAAAAGAALTDADRERCAILEERLRDTLRAPVFATDDALHRATSDARRRGTQVILLDEGGLDDEALAAPVRVALIDELDATSGGTVTARALPPGRNTSATIVIEVGHRVRRVEFDAEGRVRVEVRNGDVPDLDYQAVRSIVGG
ncbi:conserved membrane hypothetical protein [Rhodococcus sp. RD6.2]|nr:conserved membrane hypothetical protein [Rhodococcus sp. RD6.2]